MKAAAHSSATGVLLNGRLQPAPQRQPFDRRMIEHNFSQAQADLRDGYLNGAPGVLVSGVVWLVSGMVAVLVSDRAAVSSLLIGGVAIHPLGMWVARLLGRRGSHSAGNPLGRMAAEGTFWLMAGIAVAYGIQVLRIEWFFPAMLLVIGGRYFTFQTLYGLRLYWALGAVLCVLGVAFALARAPAEVSALTGGVVEVVFAGLLFRQVRAAG